MAHKKIKQKEMTTEHEIIRDNNKLIVEFLNWEKVGTYTYKSKSITEEEPDFDNRDIKTIDTFSILWGEMKFNSDWNWLMEVVEKIENLTDKDNFILYDVTIFSDSVLIADQQENEIVLVNKSEGNFTTKIEAVHNSCVEFIKWYNENK